MTPIDIENSSETNRLLRRAADGDGESLGALLTRHEGRLRRMVAFRLDPRLQGKVAPEDVLQEVYLAAAQNLLDYLGQPAMPFFFWLRGIAGHKLLELHRRHLGTRMRDARREVSLHRGALPDATSAALAAQLLGHQTRPSEAAVRAEAKIRLQEALNGMDPIDREVLALRHFEQLTNAEAARVLQIKETSGRQALPAGARAPAGDPGADARRRGAVTTSDRVATSRGGSDGEEPEELSAMNDSDSEADPLAQLAEEFAERYRRGERPVAERVHREIPGAGRAHPAACSRPWWRWSNSARSAGQAAGNFAGIAAGTAGFRRSSANTASSARWPAAAWESSTKRCKNRSAGMWRSRYCRRPGSCPRPTSSDSAARHGRRRGCTTPTSCRSSASASHEGVHYFAMQFIRGQGLDRVLHELVHLRRRVPAAGGPPTWRSADLSQQHRPGAAQRPVPRRGEDRRTVPAGDTTVCDRAMRSSLDCIAVRTGPGSIVLGDPSGLGEQSTLAYSRSVARVGVQVAEALAYSHQQGILHRDIKPANLLLDNQGTVWVSDFGLVKESATEELTSQGDFVGTLRYMAPERFLGHSDPRSDVYSLGLTLYEMLTLRPAFAAPIAHRLVERMQQDEPPGPASSTRTFPATWRRSS